jgi:3-hydroxyisobutyrate dehydrogenase-like beta-hydroxyacid dehydrogenase
VSALQIGFIGLGTMGAGMVKNLLGAGHHVRGYNRTTARAEALREHGMELAETPAAAAKGASCVILCVSNDEAVAEVVFEEGTGILGALEQGALVLDCGTSGQTLTARLDSELRSRGVRFLDAPITGSKLGAEGGKLTFMVGGSEADFQLASPLFDVMGKHAVHVGPSVGQGQAAKYCLNMTQAVVLEGVLEGYTLARSLGVPLEKMSEIFENSAGKTGVGSFKTPYLVAADYTPHFRLDLMHKDLHIALGEAERRRIPLPAANAVRTLYDQGVAEGLGAEDFLVLARLLERWAGIELRD